MTRSLRGFVLAYALAMTVLTVACGYWPGYESISEMWYEGGAVAVACLAVALGFLLCRDSSRGLSLPWLAVALGINLSQFAAFLAENGYHSSKDYVVAVVQSAWTLGYLAASAWLYRALCMGVGEARMAAWRRLNLGLWIAGGTLVLSSLFLKISFPLDESLAFRAGWEVVLGKVPWVTAFANPASGLYGNAGGIRWLQPLYASGGSAVYLAALAATLAMAAWLAARRASVERLKSSRRMTDLAAVFLFCAFWLYSDIFWGWHYDLADVSWHAALATGLWLGGPVLALALLIPVAMGKREAWRLQALLLLQAPLAVFNAIMLPHYFSGLVPDADLNLPGLAALMIGLQLESWACIGLLFLPAAETEPTAGGQFANTPC
jgi:hypothetical protein